MGMVPSCARSLDAKLRPLLKRYSVGLFKLQRREMSQKGHSPHKTGLWGVMVNCRHVFLENSNALSSKHSNKYLYQKAPNVPQETTSPNGNNIR
eukprot:3752268-Amphidinium_carterae.1